MNGLLGQSTIQPQGLLNSRRYPNKAQLKQIAGLLGEIALEEATPYGYYAGARDAKGSFGDALQSLKKGEGWGALGNTGMGLLAGASMLPLVPNVANKIKRARAMGFNPDKTWYHGSTHDITDFGKGKTYNPEGHLGASHYFTDSPHDASVNYAGEGPDLTGRIERRSEQLAQDAEYDRDVSEDVAERYGNWRARKELKGDNEGAVYPVHLKDSDTLDLTPQTKDTFEFDIEYDDAGDIVDEGGSAVELYEAIQEVAWNYDGQVDSQELWNQLADTVYFEDGASAYDVDQALRHNSQLMHVQDEMGNLASSEFIKEVYENLGYKSATIDASKSFPNMEIEPGTVHKMVFNPKDIRSVNAKFDPNKKDSGNILAGVAPVGLLGLSATRERKE